MNALIQMSMKMRRANITSRGSTARPTAAINAAAREPVTAQPRTSPAAMMSIPPSAMPRR